MEIPKLSQKIVEQRRAGAPVLGKMIEKTRDYTEKLEEVSGALQQLSDLDTPVLKEAGHQIATLTEELKDLEKRTDIRFARFDSGLVTVSIAGLEKAGKTTFLRSLTNIEALPAFDERCTAVCCEIHFDDKRSDFDIEFYSEPEFMDRVIRPVIETIAEDLPESEASYFRPPNTAAEFINMHMPGADLLPGGTTAYKLLTDLIRLKENFLECRQNLGKKPLLMRPLEELKDWVSHKQSDVKDETGDEAARGRHLARVSAARVCRIYTSFKGGSKHLRWIDTPGVDDPNRRARDLTLSTIASETDLLVLASRPGSSPSPNENFHRFWDSVSRQPDEVKLLSRLLFALNCDRRVDPTGENIRIHRKYLIDAGVPAHIFTGPYEAIKETDAAALMQAVNDHLARHLADQDELAVSELESRLKNIQARIRLLHDNLAKTHPSDASQLDLETETFHKWFHWYYEGKDSGFWTDLIQALDRSTRTILEDQRILDSESSLKEIFLQEAKNIQDRIPLPEELDAYLVKHRGENPIPSAMRAISLHFSKLINRLSDEIQEFGPIMQDELVSVLVNAGLMPLLSGESGGEKLKNLLGSFDQGLDLSSSGNDVTEVLQEALELPRNLKYVIRYELRPAVDFCDPTLWNDQQQAWTRLCDMITSNGGDVERLAEIDVKTHPPISDSREKDHEILKKITGNAMLGIHTVLSNERYLPKRIADDFMRDCRVRLCFGPESEQQWRSLLFKNRGILLASNIGQIRTRSEGIRRFHTALSRLEASLP
ncbi:hypothetical protein QUF76_17420 [Desulfobacterales bacterium HSG16]|nr:hypothetical protein [Desulfobacterales bacterium HSG16]